MEETTDQADTAVVALTEAEVVVALVVEDLHLVVDAVLTGVETEETVRCSKPHVVTAGKTVRYLLDPQTVNPSIVVTVLRKWVMVEEVMPQETILDPPPQFQIKIVLKLMPLMSN